MVLVEDGAEAKVVTAVVRKGEVAAGCAHEVPIVVPGSAMYRA